MLAARIFSFSHNVFCPSQNLFRFLYPASKKRGYTILALSVLTSITNIFCHTFLGNHASQPLQTWYGALARGPICHLLNSGLPAIYFLFPGLVHFLMLHLGIAGVYSVNKNSEFLFSHIYFVVCKCFQFGPI